MEEQMKRFTKACSMLILLVLPGGVWAQSVSTTTPPSQGTSANASGSTAPGVATGQRIGNAISAAVSTAFPEIDKILNAIWPNRTQHPNEEKKATDAETALKPIAKSAATSQNSNAQDLVKAATN